MTKFPSFIFFWHFVSCFFFVLFFEFTCVAMSPQLYLPHDSLHTMQFHVFLIAIIYFQFSIYSLPCVIQCWRKSFVIIERDFFFAGVEAAEIFQVFLGLFSIPHCFAISRWAISFAMYIAVYSIQDSLRHIARVCVFFRIVVFFPTSFAYFIICDFMVSIYVCLVCRFRYQFRKKVKIILAKFVYFVIIYIFYFIQDILFVFSFCFCFSYYYGV